MSIVFAAIVPHSPILVPSIGREHLGRLKKTTEAMTALEQELAAAKPDAILIISPHGPVAESHFTVDLNERYACNLKEFGVFDFSLPCRADMQLTNDLREHAEDAGMPVMLRSEESLDYGTIVPLMLLTPRLGPFAVIPVSPSLLPAKTHYEFGKVIQETLMRSNRRVAVIASADLSHRLTENAPGGFSPSGAAFDEKVVQLIAGRNSSGLLNLDPELVKEAGECGLSTLIIFSGIFDRMNLEPEVLSYEGPFGVGGLVARYRTG